MDRPEIKIRRARPGDIDSLTALLRILFSIEKDFTFDEHRQQQGIRLILESPACGIWIAEVSGSVVGMCSGQLTISTAEGGFSLLVEDVVVEEKWRGKGIGRKLLDNLAKWGVEQGAHRMQLLADRNNAEALWFYENFGWQRTQLICLRKKQARMSRCITG